MKRGSGEEIWKSHARDADGGLVTFSVCGSISPITFRFVGVSYFQGVSSLLWTHRLWFLSIFGE